MNFWKEFFFNLGFILLIISTIFIFPVLGFVGIGLLFTCIWGGIVVFIASVVFEALCITLWLNL